MKLEKVGMGLNRIVMFVISIVIAVSILASFFILRNSIGSTITEAKELSKNQGIYLSDQINNRFSSYRKISSILANNQRAAQYMQNTLYPNYVNMMNASYELQKDLSYTINMYAADVITAAYYFPEGNSVITMAQWYFPGDGDTFFERLGLITDEDIAAADTTPTVVRLSGDSKSFLIHKATVYQDKVAYVILIFDLSSFADLIDGEGTVVMIDYMGEFIWANGGHISEENCHLLRNQIETGDTVKYNKSTYLGVSNKLPVGGFTASVFVPIERFATLERLFGLITAAAIIVLIASLILVFQYIQTRFIRPIHALINKTEGNSSRDIRDSLNQIGEKYVSLKSEHADIQGELSNMRALNFGKFLTHLVEQGSNQASAVLSQQCMRLADLETDSSYAVCAMSFYGDASEMLEYASLSSKTESKMSLLYYALHDMLSDSLEPYYTPHIAQMQINLYMIIFECDKEELPQIQKGIEQIRNEFQRTFNESLFATPLVFGRGEEEFPSLVTESYNIMSYQRFWRSEKQVAGTGNREGMTVQYRKLQRVFVNRLEIEDYTGAADAFHDILESCIPTNTEDLPTAELNIYGIISILVTVLFDQFGQNKDFLDRLNIEEMYKIDNIIDFKRKVDSILEQMDKEKIHAMGETDDDSASENMDSIRAYILDNFTQNDLSLASIASRFGMNSSYLSRTYKQGFGINILEQIQRLRVDKAKELLPHNSIKDIAPLVGYWDSQGLMRAFKKIEGISPSEYKSTILKQNKT